MGTETKALRTIIFLAALTMLMSSHCAAEGLVYSKDLTYEGAFRVPKGTYGCSKAEFCSFNYGGFPMAYNPVRNSLFLAGHMWHQNVAEISIPEIFRADKIEDLKTADVLQPFSEITEGGINGVLGQGNDLTVVSVEGERSQDSTTTVVSSSRKFVKADVGRELRITGGNGFKYGSYKIKSVKFRSAIVGGVAGAIGSTGGVWSLDYSGAVVLGGLLVYENKLIGTGYISYSGTEQVLSHFYREGLNIADKGAFHGMYKVGKTPSPVPGAEFVGGYMAAIPEERQSEFKAAALTGLCCIAVTTRSSQGPAAFVFDPGELGKVEIVPASPVLYYPAKHPALGKYDSTNPTYNGVTRIKGIVFPAGTDSVLFFGRHGAGKFCYGPGTTDAGLAGTPAVPAGAGTYCYDLASSDKGTHAYPYLNQVWAYDANELLAVKNGRKLPWEVKPYAVWTFDLPFQSARSMILGVAYDPVNQRIFISQGSGEGDYPVIHVLKVSVVPVKSKR